MCHLQTSNPGKVTKVMTNTNCPVLPDTLVIDNISDVISSLRDEGVGEIIGGGIPHLDGCPSYEEFFLRFLLPNKPCVLSSEATAKWQSRREWVCKDGKPDFEFLRQHFGDAVVPVADCGKQEYCAHPKQEMLLGEFLQYLCSDHAGSEECLYLKDWHFTRSFPDYTAYETPVYFRSDWLNEFWDTQLDKPDDYKFVYMGPKDSWRCRDVTRRIPPVFVFDHAGSEECLYLKDWHFTRSFPDYTAYETPVYFRSDWLNEFWDTQLDKPDDYKFVYMGPKDSWTPLHADVMRSFSWSANVCGRKKWILFPPGEEEALKDRFGQLVFDVTSSDLENTSTYPNYGKLQHQFEVIQEAGEVIFVPSGWHHQVVNLEDTISINHNWFNGCNIDICWKFMKQSLADVKKEISDCRSMDGWHQQCQLILKASAGIDVIEFYGLLLSIALHRLKSIGCLDNSIMVHQLSLDVRHSCDSDTANSTPDPSSVNRNKIGKSSSDKHGDSIANSSAVFSIDKTVFDHANINKTSKSNQENQCEKDFSAECAEDYSSLDGKRFGDSKTECLSNRIDGHSLTNTNFHTVFRDKTHSGDCCLDLLDGLSQEDVKSGLFQEPDVKVGLSKKADIKAGLSQKSDVKDGLSQETDVKAGLSQKADIKAGLSPEADIKYGLSCESDVNAGLSEETAMKAQLLSKANGRRGRLQNMHWRFCEKRHALFDLSRVKDIVLEVTQDEDWIQLDTSCLSVSPRTLLNEILLITKCSK
ncbi:uncharacterized protein LOC121389344 [Gigantopelta aegis]|uniref:uncharacterized protein LOC121389344 n=1 Tax=Gigantopelta aegis TaxID=1735272 RepID=UPI001B88D128|nr:uncharacterized protein LOC121389344 [Gigantopelta aegis]